MYTPQIPNFNDPFDREWMILVAAYMGVVSVVGIFYALVNPLLQ